MKKKILVTKNLLKETEGRVQKLFDVKLNKEEKQKWSLRLQKM